MGKKISIKDFFIMAVGMFLISVAVYYAMLPGGFVMGSISGLVMVLVNFIPLKVSTMTFILNVGLLLIGYIFIGKEFGGKTIITSIMLPGYIWIFEQVTPNPGSLSGNLIIDMLSFMFLISFGQALLFSMNASSGGLDIVAKLLNKYFHLKIGESLTVVGFIIAGTSYFISNKETMVISLVGTYIYGIVLDYFCDGFRIRKRVCILSSKYLEIQDYIVKDLHRGATLYQVMGAHSNTQRVEIETVMEKNEYGKLLAFIHETDPSAFLTVSTVTEVIGEWLKPVKKRKR